MRQGFRDEEQPDGLRVLVDRVWPRGISKDRAALDLWARDLAPSDGLRRWFHEERGTRHDEFVRRYREQLDGADHDGLPAQLREHEEVLLLTRNKDVGNSHVPVLQEWLRELYPTSGRSSA